MNTITWKAHREITAKLFAVSHEECRLLGLTYNLKPDCEVWRIQTAKMAIFEMCPLVAISKDRKRIYFLTEESKWTDTIIFETKASKVVSFSYSDES